MDDIHALKVFLAVVDKLSFTRAAESLFLTQSAVSHQVARLEKSFGTPLFNRVGRKVEVTEAGNVLIGHARRVFAQIEQAHAEVRRAAHPEEGSLRIGASSTACEFFIPESLREFNECFPRYRLSIIPGDSPVIAERLLEGLIDLGILIRPDQKLKLDYQELFTDYLGVVVSPLHPWARDGKVNKKDLGDQQLVLYNRSSATFRLVERHLLRQKMAIRDPIELGSMQAIKALIKLGLGVGVMAKWTAIEEIEERSLVWLPLPGPKLRRVWCVGYASGRSLSLAEQTYIGLCQAAAKEIKH